MAQGSIGGTTANPYIEARILWESEGDASDHSSALTARLQLRRTNHYSGTPTGGIGRFSLRLGAQLRSISGLALTIPNDGSWVTALEAAARIPHEADGTQTLLLEASGELPPSSVTWVECRGEAVLDKLTRGSRICSFRSDNGRLDGLLEAGLQPMQEGVTHKWRLLLGGELLDEGILLAGTTYWDTALTEAQLARCYLSAPAAPQVELLWELSCFADAACTQPLGQPQQAAALLALPQNEATLPQCSLTHTPAWEEEILEEDAYLRQLYLEGKTGLLAQVAAQGQHGASIREIRVELDGQALEQRDDGFYLPLLSRPGNFTLLATVTDSRGFTSHCAETLSVRAYADPRLLSAACFRCKSDGAASEEGEQLMIRIQATHSYFAGHNGDDNLCTLSLQAKTVGREEYAPELLLFTSGKQDQATVVLEGIAIGEDGEPVRLDSGRSYQIRLILRDLLGQPLATEFLIPTARIHCHEGQGFFSLGQYSKGPGVDIGKDWPVRIHGQLLLGEAEIPLEDYIRSIINGG